MNAPDDQPPRPDDADANDADAHEESTDDETGGAYPDGGSAPSGGSGESRPVVRSSPSATRTSNDPGYDEITPEYVEEETQRNDFVLRWAVVLLAFFVASTPIHETRTLVHVRTGEYLVSNGLLPPRTDPFSIAAGERTWANTEWLFDILVAGVYSAGGAVGLTLLKAALAALTFYFVVHTSRRGSSSWWGSICAAVAVMVCALRFTALPEIVTLLGLAVVMWLLARWRQSDSDRLPWELIPVFVVWANMDANVWIGLALLVLYGLGEFVSELLDSSAVFASGGRSQYWIAVVGCVVAAMCNPFGWETLLAPVKLYASQYPALREHALADLDEGQRPAFSDLQYLPMISGAFWKQADIQGVCGIFLLIVGFGAAALNHRRLDAGAIFVLAGFTALAVATVHELAAAALVAAVFGTLAAQEWYADVSGGTSTNRTALAFARGGRALTVFGLLGIALLAMNGRLSGPTDMTRSRGLGFGLDSDLETRIAGLEAALAEMPTDYRAFHTTREAGDRLLWLGRKSFVDGRTALFAERDGTNLYDEFDDLVAALPNDRPLAGDPRVPQSVLDERRIDYVVHALSGETPPESYSALVASPLWIIYDVGGDDAVLLRRTGVLEPDADEEERTRVEQRVEFANRRGFDPVTEVFGSEREPLGVRADVGRSAIAYPEWFVPRNRVTTPELERARQLRRHLQWIHEGRFGPQPRVLAVGFAYLTLNESNLALVEDTQQADAYTLLGQIRWHLANNLEPSLVADGGRLPREFQTIYNFRRLQAINEFAQSARIDPENLESHTFLFIATAHAEQHDLAVRYRDEVVRILENGTATLTNPQLERMLDEEQRERRMERVEEVRAEAMKRIEAKMPQYVVAQLVRQQGCVELAIELLNEAIEKEPQLIGNPQVLQLAARLDLDAGRLEEALEKLAQLEQLGMEINTDGQRTMAIAAAAAGRHEQALEALAAERENHRRQRDMFMFDNALPFVAAPPMMAGSGSNGWLMGLPVRAGMSFLTAIQAKQRMAEVSTLMLLLQLESGRLDEARETAISLMENHVDSPLLPLVVEYSKVIGARPENVFRDDLPPAPPAVDE